MKKILLFLTIVYVLSHLARLTILPVFADESIYIRWAQLIIDDWSRYLFFPLNDGKTPLWMWSLAPFQFIGPDQLWSARLVAVLVGWGQTLTMAVLAFRLTSSKKTAFVAGIFTCLLPFWYFHHRMALIDGLLTWLLSAAFLMTVITLQKTQLFLSQQKKEPTTFSSVFSVLFLKKVFTHVWLELLLGGIFFGLSLYTKLPALLFVPALGIPAFASLGSKHNGPASLSTFVMQCLLIGKIVGIGLFLFVLLKLNPAFGQLFSRGGDFLYPWQEVFLHGQWLQTMQNIPSYANYFGTYLTWPILILAVAGLFVKKYQTQTHVVFWGSILFLLPIVLLGKVVYPRYLLPSLIGFTLASSFTLTAWWDWLTENPHLWVKMIGGLALASMVGQIFSYSALFIQSSLTDPNTIPFVSADREQYLTEWSSGHGITKTVAFITEQTKHTSVAVATEGYFGTLPDALLLYFHRHDIPNLAIEGIGQPVASIPTSFWKRAIKFEKVYLVVNSHRLSLPLDTQQLVAQYCRPYAAPCLQIWDITSLRPIDLPSEY